jgi:hypothetical protein
MVSFKQPFPVKPAQVAILFRSYKMATSPFLWKNSGLDESRFSQVKG